MPTPAPAPPPPYSQQNWPARAPAREPTIRPPYIQRPRPAAVPTPAPTPPPPYTQRRWPAPVPAPPPPPPYTQRRWPASVPAPPSTSACGQNWCAPPPPSQSRAGANNNRIGNSNRNPRSLDSLIANFAEWSLKTEESSVLENEIEILERYLQRNDTDHSKF